MKLKLTLPEGGGVYVEGKGEGFDTSYIPVTDRGPLPTCAMEIHIKST